ncbi:PepSY domain-containing protein [Actinokineospora sp.]|uniref:PepSY domain-containing protein n=1 Tax=Actinokineospora sp. TaxID=1872133 RepID=UPI004037A773
MNRRTTWIAGTALALILAGAGAAIAAANAGEGPDTPITGDSLTKASAAALANTPGIVTETEVGDEEGFYEIEVTRADGSRVDVHLGADFAVLGTAADEGTDDPGK